MVEKGSLTRLSRLSIQFWGSLYNRCNKGPVDLYDSLAENISVVS